MSDILTGPDRGPPATDWRREAARLNDLVWVLVDALETSHSACQCPYGDCCACEKAKAALHKARGSRK